MLESVEDGQEFVDPRGDTDTLASQNCFEGKIIFWLFRAKRSYDCPGLSFIQIVAGRVDAIYRNSIGGNNGMLQVAQLEQRHTRYC